MSDPAGFLRLGEMIYNSYKKANIFTGLNINTYWRFRNGAHDEHDWRCLFAYLSLKSIIGNKTFAKTDNKMMFARMYGKDSKKDFDKMSPVGITRYQRDKIIFDLQCYWNMKYYAYGVWGFYYSFDKFSLEKLVLTAESRKKKNQAETLRDAKEKARQNALKTLSK